MLEMKNTNLEMKNAFNELINRLGMAKEGIVELEEMSVENSKTELQRKRIKMTGIQELQDNYKRYNIYI